MSFGLTDPPIQQLRENMYNVTNKIDRENVLDYGIIGNKRVLKMQYVLIEDIASKKEN